MTDDSQTDRLDRLEALVEEQQSAIESQREQIERLQRSQRATVELVADGGDAKMIGHHTASDGETYGVLGEVDSEDGYGLYTPDDVKIEGGIDTADTDFVVEAGPTDDARNVIMGHGDNTVGDDIVGATISGGGRVDRDSAQNRVFGDYGTVGGGRHNRAGTDGEDSATVAGGWQNEATGNRSTVAGGARNDATGETAAVGGGLDNTASGGRATVGGGQDNVASDDHATVSGGDRNEASDSYGTVGGGENNEARQHSTVGGGENNDAIDRWVAVGGGRDNEASGRYAAIPGGLDNTADGQYSFATGRAARAEHDGAVVFGDSSEDEISSTAENQVRFQQDISASGDVSVSGVLSGFDGVTIGPRVSDPTSSDLAENQGMLFVSSGAPDVTGSRGDLVYVFNDDGDVETTVVQSNPS